MHSEGMSDAKFVFSDILNPLSLFFCLDLQEEKLLT